MARPEAPYCPQGCIENNNQDQLLKLKRFHSILLYKPKSEQYDGFDINK